MNKQNNEGEEIDKGALSDDEPLTGVKTATHGKGKNTKKVSRILPINTKQETAGRLTGKSTTHTYFEDKAGDAARRNEIENPDRFKPSKQGQWPGYLTFFGVVVVLFGIGLSFVCFRYEKKIDKMNEELETFRTELIDIRAYLKKLNIQYDTDASLKNTKIQKDVNTILDTFTSNLTKMNDTINILGDEISTDIQNISTVLTETLARVWENDTRLSKELSSLNLSIASVKTDTAQEYTSLKWKVDILNEVVERNISEKVKTFDYHLDILHNAKEKADHIISQLEKDVDKIFPNTFNKGSLIAAFMLLLLIVLLCAVALYRLYCKLETCQQDIGRLKGLEVQYTQWLKADKSYVVSNTDKFGIESTINTERVEAPAGCEVDGSTPRTIRQDD